MADERDQNLVSLDDGGWQVADGEPDVRGWDVVTADQRKVGRVDDLLADPAAEKVRFMTVEMSGMAKGDERFRVPISRARIDEGRRQVIVDASSAADLGDLTTAHASSGVSTNARDRIEERDRVEEPKRTSEDQIRMTRAAEEIRIGKRQVQAGEVELKKRVDTEHVRDQVRLRSEDVDVQRRPVTGGREVRDVEITDKEVRVPVFEEQAVVEKRPVVKEEVIVSKQPTERTETVEADVREEHIDVEKHGDMPRDRDRSR
jgi:uncharacterized protein (TIGR02271 family)